MASTTSLNFRAGVLDKALGNEQAPRHSPTKKRKVPVTLKTRMVGRILKIKLNDCEIKQIQYLAQTK